jgi:lipopolysaccharide/colanic/teichoic acid biosynthesis glycosyltransferase
MMFVVTPEEESRLLRAISNKGGRISVIAGFTDGTAGMAPHLSTVSRLVVTTGAVESLEVADLVCDAHVRGVHVMDIETALLEIDPTVPSIATDVVRNIAQRGIHQDAGVRAYTAIKHFVEPALGVIALVLLSPLIALVAIAIKATSPGPVFYRQTRVGLRGKLFDIVKFRSMRIDAEASGPVWASAKTGDPRLTPIGGFLRATHLDEIPQFWNVATGDLSFVGPRPERPVFCEALAAEVPLFRLRTLVKPGITGWAQIRQGYANSVADSRRKLEYDLFYIMKHSFLLDLSIVIGTIAVVFSGGTEGRKRARTVAEARPVPRSVLPGFSVKEDAAAQEVSG